MKVQIIIAFVLGTLFFSCKQKIELSDDNDSDLIKISKAQFISEEMVMGEPSLHPFVNQIHCTGTIIPSVNGQAQISLPLPGIIEKIHARPGQMVQEGTVLFEISGHWFIDLQKDFSESSAVLSKLKSDYSRAKELYDENISSQKEFATAESDYYAENAKHKALKTKLESMGLDVTKIEKGAFYPSYTLRSPINGFVSSIDASIGQYIEPQQTIAELIDNNSFQIKLSVFEKDIPVIHTGQSVWFYPNGNKTAKHKATIDVIGKTIMPHSRAIECYAIIDKPESIHLVSNQFVEGEIFTAVDSILAVRETAIIESENETYVLMYEKEDNSMYYFKKIPVKTGRKSNNYIELTEQLPAKKLLTNGTYNIVID